MMSTLLREKRTERCPICLSTAIRINRHKCGFPIAVCHTCLSEYAVLSDSDLPSYDDHYQPGSIYEGYRTIAHHAAHKIDESLLYWYQPRMLDVAGPGNGRLHIDIGSGMGTFPAITRSRGWRVRGVDISQQAADNAKRNFGIDTHVGEIRDLDVPNETVDWVSAFEVLEHVMRPRDFLQDIHKLLKPGGLVTISVPNGRSRSEIYSEDPLISPPTHVNFFSRKGLSRMFSECGFEKLYDYEKPIAWSELKVRKIVRYLLLPVLLVDSYMLGYRGNRLLWVGRKRG